MDDLQYHLDQLEIIDVAGRQLLIISGSVRISAPDSALRIELRDCEGCLASVDANRLPLRPDVLVQGFRGFGVTVEVESFSRPLELIALSKNGERVLKRISIAKLRQPTPRRITRSCRIKLQAPLESAGNRFGTGRTEFRNTVWPNSSQIRALMITHNLNLEGAPKVLLEIGAGLKRLGSISPVTYSPIDGPLCDRYEQASIPTLSGSVQMMSGTWPKRRDYLRCRRELHDLLRQTKPDIVVANTLLNFHAVNVARELGIPSLLLIYESDDIDSLVHKRRWFDQADCLRAFEEADCVVYCSHESRSRYKWLDQLERSTVIHSGIDPTDIDNCIRSTSPSEARHRLSAAPGRKVILTVGTVHDRKAQHVLVDAAARLRKRRDDFCCFLVGARDQADLSGYLNHIRRRIDIEKLHNVVRLVPETNRVHDYYRAADVFVLSSMQEAYNVSVLEAEAFGLPIVATPCCGVSEQTRADNCVQFPLLDSAGLARKLNDLLDDDQQRKQMAKASRRCFNSLTSQNEMVTQFEQAILSATRNKHELNAA